MNSPEKSKRSLIQVLSAFRSARFYVISILVLFGTSIGGYLLSDFGIQFDIFSTYRMFPEQLQNILSVEKWWLNKTLELAIPMFLFFSLRLQLLKIDDDIHEKIIKLLPWLTPVSRFFISGLPIFFMATAGTWFGVTGYLTFNGGVNYAWFLVFPTAIAGTSLMMRNALSMSPEEGCFKAFVLKRKDGLAITMLVVASILWIWVSGIDPLMEKLALYQYAEQTSSQ
ncbi:MAG: hypothetical protein ACJAT1_002038 [Marivirga sp.]|jgi:hypothetical protein